ncbi:MAG: hypothetical protein ABSC54_08005 [Smithellaceae bacterium]|jgi:hypothetical protein
MPPDEQVSRYEVNRNVRTILTRHDVDLTRIDYSFMGNTVYLYGDLVRPNGDYSVSEIESIIREIAVLSQVRDIQFDLNNWVVVPSGESWQITKPKKSAVKRVVTQPGALGDSTVVIDKAENLTDVLDDLESDSKKEEDDKRTNPK